MVGIYKYYTWWVGTTLRERRGGYYWVGTTMRERCGG